jgi:hypothetical protein
MSKDIEYFDEEGHDFISLFRDVVAKVPFKKAALLTLVMFLVFSTVFINIILARIPGTVNVEVTTRGTVVQIIVVIFAYIIIDYAVNAGAI